MIIRRMLTHNAEDDGRPIGVGYYMDGWLQVLKRPAGFARRDYPNGWTRRVWTDKDGRSTAVAWHYPY